MVQKGYLGKEPMSAATHLAGFVAAIFGLILLTVWSSFDTPKMVSMIVYGSTLGILFLASTVYHYLDLGDKGNNWLRKFDHSAIFLLIAGSYVPAMMHFLDGTWRISMLSVIAGLTVMGIIFKLVWINCPRFLSVSIYVAMGCLVVVPGHIVFPQLRGALGFWAIAGGLAYLIGAVVYLIKRPDPWPDYFGFHEIWHLFVLAGALSHFIFNVYLIGYPRPAF